MATRVEGANLADRLGRRVMADVEGLESQRLEQQVHGLLAKPGKADDVGRAQAAVRIRDVVSEVLADRGPLAEAVLRNLVFELRDIGADAPVEVVEVQGVRSRHRHGTRCRATLGDDREGLMPPPHRT